MAGHPPRGQKKFFAALTACALILALTTQTNAAPSVTVTYPNGGETLSGTETLTWTTSDSGGLTTLTGALHYSSLPGEKNNLIAKDINLMEACDFGTTTGIWTSDPMWKENLPDFTNNGLVPPSEEFAGQPSFFVYDSTLQMLAVKVNATQADTRLLSYEWNNNGKWIPGDFNTGAIKYDVNSPGFNPTRYNTEVAEIDDELYLFIDLSLVGLTTYKWNNVSEEWEPDYDLNATLDWTAAEWEYDPHYEIRHFKYGGISYLLIGSTSHEGVTKKHYRAFSWNGSVWTETFEIANDFNANYGNYTLSHSVYYIGSQLRAFQSTTQNPGIRDSIFNGVDWVNATDDYNANVTSPVAWIDTVVFDGNVLLFNASTRYDWNAYYFAEAGGYDTTVAADCSYDWDTTNANDGFWYFDVNASNGLAETIDSSDSFFTISNVPGLPPGFFDIQKNKVGIYISADEWELGTSAFMHNWQSFAANSNGSNRGKIQIDGVVMNTCNRTWDCQLDLNAGTHSYTLYSSIKGIEQTGHFTIDLNTTTVRIYVPIAYSVFDIYEDKTATSLLPCSSIYSLQYVPSPLNADSIYWTGMNGRVNYCSYTSEEPVICTEDIFPGTPPLFNKCFSLACSNNAIIPRNCYAGINPLYPYALPAKTEKSVITYTSALGMLGDIFGIHRLHETTIGRRNTEGLINFYSLHEAENSQFVEQKVPGYYDGRYSPIVSIISPSMNEESAIYGDANYNPGDFGAHENITCEASLHSHGLVVYDVNFLLITDQNTIYAQSHFQPSIKYNYYMERAQPSGAYNIVWHTFENVDHNGFVQCAVQTVNEVGFFSGWAISPKRRMHGSSYSADQGISVFVKDEDGSASYSRHKSPYTADSNYIDIYNFKHAPYFWQYDTASNPLTLHEGDGIIAQTFDINSGRASSKVFNIDRGDQFSISLYLADNDAINQAPVARKTTLTTQASFSRVLCKTEFYDRDLDWNKATFRFWTSREGSFSNPTCEAILSYARTTNCNPKDRPCLTPGATETLNNECGYDNDCYVQHYFNTRDCSGISAGQVTGYCGILLEDTNGNQSVAQGSTVIDIERYYLFAACEAYALVNNEKQDLVFTRQEQGFVECEIGVDNMLHPDTNFTAVFEGKRLTFLRTNYDSYLDRETHVFRAEVTAQLDALARRLTQDNETWAGDATVFITHPVYGSLDATVPCAVSFVGARFVSGADYTEAEFNYFYDWVTGFALGYMTDPIGTFQSRFFETLVILILIVLLVPLIIAASASARARGEE